MTRAKTVVVGTYPPIPLPSADASVAAVRRGWEAGDEVTVVSPRLSAAPLAVPVVGVLAGHRLENVRRHTGATRLVLVVERGFPIRTGAPWLRWATVAGLTRSMRRFENVTVVRVGALGIPQAAADRLTSVAHEVVEHPVHGWKPPGPWAVGVTPLGPVETLPRERPRQLAAAAARRVLGPRAGQVRERLSALRRRLAPGSAPK